MLNGQDMCIRPAEEVEGVGGKGIGDTTQVTVKTVLELCEQLLDLELFSSTVKVSQSPMAASILK